MRVFVTGATGFVGRALIPRLQRDGHAVVAWVRSPARARGLLGGRRRIGSRRHGSRRLVAAIERSDAVVNLAGEPLMGGRWTAARRAVLEGSRIAVTEQLVRAMAEAKSRPRVFISGSAVGYYGERTDELLTEASSTADDFLARLCQRWECAAQEADRLGARVVLLRTGVVLGRAGGALAQVLPPFQLGAGGPVGSGKQYLPWVHLHDLVKIIAVALADDRYRGPVNGVAPEQTTSRSFARALGRALHRPAILPLPALALKVIFGEAATVLLASQRVDPCVLREHQFAFDFPTLDSALEDIVGGTAVAISPAQSRPEGAGEARYELRARTVIDAPLDQTFAFFSKAANLGVITPAAMQFSISGPAAADGGGRPDRLSRARRSSTSSLAHPHHHVGAGPKFCRSSREGPVPLLVAQSHISGRWPAHGDGGSRVLHTPARARRAAGESRLHPLDTQEDLSVSRRCDPSAIRSVVV
jgi:uncharacterized protein